MIRKTTILSLSILFSLILCGNHNVVAQLNQGGMPVSFTLPAERALSVVEFERMPEVDIERLRQEDQFLDHQPQPWRFGENIEVNYTPDNSGVWDELPEGGRIWRLGIASPGALSLNLTFTQYHLPPGAQLFVYSHDKDHLLGAFTEENNQDDRLFATTLLLTDRIIIEYYEPARVDFTGRLQLGTVTHGYRGVGEFMRGFGDSGWCNLNVACPEAEGWEAQIRSVVMLVSGSNGFCTGAMVNNTNHDGTPLLLSANHCYQSSGPGSIVFWFNWQSATCDNPAESPSYQALSGAMDRARHNSSDYWLLELNHTPPEEYNVYLSGWNRIMDATISETIVGIHHPRGDIKKFSYATGGVEAASYGGVPGTGNTHWRIIWSGGTTTEPASSGSPIFDAQGRILGQLHGGQAACGNTLPDWYGRLGVSWDVGNFVNNNTLLSDWLDPAGTGVQSVFGYDPHGLPGDMNHDGVLDIRDVVQLVSFIQSESGYKFAADVNGDGVVDMLDVIELINMVLEQ